MHALDVLQLHPLAREAVARPGPSTPGTRAEVAAAALVHVVFLLLVEVENLLRRERAAGHAAPLDLASQGLEMDAEEFAREVPLVKEKGQVRRKYALKVGSEHRRLVVAIPFAFPRAVPQTVALLDRAVERMVL